MTRAFAATLLAALLAIAGCGDDDGSTPDSGGGTDTGPVGGDDCPPDYADCTDFMDLTAGTAAVTISGFTYDPSCIRVTVGQEVMIEGASAHPLMGSCGPDDVNPIPDMSTSSRMVTFDTPGIYGFHCNVHGMPDGGGMAGAIEVVGL